MPRIYPKTNRKPPKPKSWNCERGTCRLCGGPIVENGVVNKRKHWHQSCAQFWTLCNQPAEMRRYIYVRDLGHCQECGKDCRKDIYEPEKDANWEVDHIKPLFEALGDLSYWEPANCKLLCLDCHKDKTRSDMERWREFNKIKSIDTPSN